MASQAGVHGNQRKSLHKYQADCRNSFRQPLFNVGNKWSGIFRCFSSLITVVHLQANWRDAYDWENKDMAARNVRNRLKDQRSKIEYHVNSNIPNLNILSCIQIIVKKPVAWILSRPHYRIMLCIIYRTIDITLATVSSPIVVTYSTPNETLFYRITL